jgi:hypothetical protein
MGARREGPWWRDGEFLGHADESDTRVILSFYIYCLANVHLLQKVKKNVHLVQATLASLVHKLSLG